MLIIANQEADLNNILRQHPLNNIQQQILNVLYSSTSTYRYDTMEQLLFELKLRNEIIKTANELNKSEFAFAVYKKSRCNEEYWNRLSDGGFSLKSWVYPSDAIQDIFIHSNLYATECSTAMPIIYYKALLNIFKKPLFDKLFPNIRLKGWQHLNPFIQDVKRMKKFPDYLPGDRRYIKNPNVHSAYPEYQGENIIDMGNALYYGHGIGIAKVKDIVDELNKYRQPNSRKSAYLMDSAGRLDYKRLAGILLKNR